MGYAEAPKERTTILRGKMRGVDRKATFENVQAFTGIIKLNKDLENGRFDANIEGTPSFYIDNLIPEVKQTISKIRELDKNVARVLEFLLFDKTGYDSSLEFIADNDFKERTYYDNAQIACLAFAYYFSAGELVVFKNK